MRPKAICLRCTGDVAEFEFNVNKLESELSTKNIPRNVKRTKGNGNLLLRHNYDFDDKMIALYAWDDGEAGDENKHELPTPLDNILYFGNVYLIGHIDNKQVSITKEDYENMKEKHFEGFDDVGSEDSWSTDESVASDDSIHDFIVSG